ncbi:augurin-A [Lepisosteus oculatus]|uniref:augurin-A n=1 Tax=Lepisosteus oculatus TaxID=7918 RepID=UPI0035F52687
MLVFENLRLQLVILTVFLTVSALSDSTNENKLQKLFKKREAKPEPLAVSPSKAKEFLTALKRPKRNLWDRTRPDVQQWIQQFMYMGFDESRFETDLSYWMDHYRQHDYYGYQHHYDENAPIGPRYPSSFRHGANVNYDDY